MGHFGEKSHENCIEQGVPGYGSQSLADPDRRRSVKTNMRNNIQIELTNDEALVLFEHLSQLDDTGSLPVADHAEELVLGKIQCQLEKALVEPFDPKYKDLILEAKAKVTKE